MDLLLSNEIMTKRLVLEWPMISSFFIFNLISAVIIWIAAIVKLKTNIYSLTRLSFCLAVAVGLIFVTPLVIFSESVELSLSKPWVYAMVINGAAVVLMGWAYLSHSFDVVYENSSIPVRVNQIHLVTGVLGVALIGVYFSKVPWDCSGAYALFNDPPYTLLARELVGKLAGGSFSIYALAAYVNAVAPVFIFFSIWRVGGYLSSRKIVAALTFAILGFLAVSALLVSGTKGFLLPSTLMLVVAVLFYTKTWKSRVLGFVMTGVFFYCALATFELLKERGSYVINGRYDFAACAVKVNACEGSLNLIESMQGQAYPLGLPVASLKMTQSRLACLCEGGESKTCPSLVGNEKIATNNFINENDSMIVLEVASSRLKSFTEAVIYRIFVVPFQVSVWHFMYAETEVVDGVKTLPFARRLTGDSLNMPELVYQKYGSIYWDGDKTTTSSAPTSFIWTYTAYLGWFGFCVALGCILSLDLLMAGIARILGKDLLPIHVGILLIMSVNFTASDFVTVLVSHGGLAGILVLLICAVLLKIEQKKA
jgi:hypothetical protein